MESPGGAHTRERTHAWRTLAARSGEVVTVLRDDGVTSEWVRVRNGESREGWIPREFLKMLQ